MNFLGIQFTRLNYPFLKNMLIVLKKKRTKKNGVKIPLYTPLISI